jgi:hypothetical protein
MRWCGVQDLIRAKHSNSAPHIVWTRNVYGSGRPKGQLSLSTVLRCSASGLSAWPLRKREPSIELDTHCLTHPSCGSAKDFIISFINGIVSANTPPTAPHRERAAASAPESTCESLWLPLNYRVDWNHESVRYTRCAGCSTA